MLSIKDKVVTIEGNHELVTIEFACLAERLMRLLPKDAYEDKRFILYKIALMVFFEDISKFCADDIDDFYDYAKKFFDERSNSRWDLKLN